MKILIIGAGGREHALIKTLLRTSERSLQLFCATGNAGIAQDAELVNIKPEAHELLVSYARDNAIDFTFVGPEAPLVAGLVDRFRGAGLAIVGPEENAARLEASKVFAKQFMARHEIPTASFEVASTPREAIGIVRERTLSASGIVVKADGLAAGKGVVVASTAEEAEAAVQDLMVLKRAGSDAANKVVIEEALTGKEVSLLLFSDGKDYELMPPARDHKRIGENDTGPNTGGMGCITSSDLIDHDSLNRVVHEIVEPTLNGCIMEGFPFKGILFLGLMLTAAGPKVLEYNVRFGDPETQAILVRLQTDLVRVLEAIYFQELGRLKIEWSTDASACVVIASKGYPGAYESGMKISGLDRVDSEHVQVFHAGTALDKDGHFVTNGGRVLGVTAAAPQQEDALKLCYEAIHHINWPGMQFRRDIGR